MIPDNVPYTVLVVGVVVTIVVALVAFYADSPDADSE